MLTVIFPSHINLLHESEDYMAD